MPSALTPNGSGLQSDHITPSARPAFGQIQDTALQHDTAGGSGGTLRSHRLLSGNSFDQTASVSSADNSTFASGQQTIARSSLENASEISPFPGPSLSDGIPPAFETGSSCGASASALAPNPGRRYSINLATGKFHRFVHSLHINVCFP